MEMFKFIISFVLMVTLITGLVYTTIRGTLDLVTIGNETVTVAGGLGNTAHYPIDSLGVLYNKTGGSILTEASDYNLTDAPVGQITFRANVSAAPLVNYVYQPSGYLSGTSERAIMGTLFIILLIGIAYTAYKGTTGGF